MHCRPMVVLAATLTFTASSLVVGCAGSVRYEEDGALPECLPEFVTYDLDEWEWEPTTPPPELPIAEVEGLLITVHWAAELTRLRDCVDGHNAVELQIGSDSIRLVTIARGAASYPCETFLTNASARIEVCGPGTYLIVVDGEELEVTVL